VLQNEIKESLFCELLKETMKAVDMAVVNNFFDSSSLSWDLVEAICADDAPTLLGKTRDSLRVVRKINPDVISSHCILHEHALASKTLPSDIQAMLGVVILILARALNYLTIKTLCREVEFGHTVLLLHTDVHWLLRKKF
jgi:hypothetical protein